MNAYILDIDDAYFQKLDLLKGIAASNDHHMDLSNENVSSFEEIKDFFGYVGKGYQSLQEQIIDLYETNLRSESAFSRLLIKFHSETSSTISQLVSEHISNEPLRYYREMAEELI